MVSLRSLPLALVIAGFVAAAGDFACAGDSAAADSSSVDQPSLVPPTWPISTTSQPAPASFFQLSGGDIEASYGPVAGSPVFVYRDRLQSLTFRGDEISTLSTPAGELVSVVIRRTVDTGSTSFSLLLPRVRLDSSAPVPVQTPGIVTVHRFSVIPRFDQGQLDAYEVVTLQGTAGPAPAPVRVQ
jgi:hypothetical protein